MPILRTHPLLQRALLILGIPLVLGSCAKFPEGGGVGEFTRVTFRFRVRGQINDSTDDSPLTRYVYIVAIRALTSPDIPATGAPTLVIGDQSPNGFVAGSPTHFVRYDSTQPQRPFTLFKFNPGPGPNDPDNPINLASFFDTSGTRPRIINFSAPVTGGDPRELSFDLFTNQLVDADNLASGLVKLQVNILTMNVLSTAGVERSYDALGNTLLPNEINTTVNVDLRFNQVINNTQLGIIEPEGDTGGFDDPDVDLNDFSIEVRRP